MCTLINFLFVAKVHLELFFRLLLFGAPYFEDPQDIEAYKTGNCSTDTCNHEIDYGLLALDYFTGHVLSQVNIYTPRYSCDTNPNYQGTGHHRQIGVSSEKGVVVGIFYDPTDLL